MLSLIIINRSAFALDVNITEKMPYISFKNNGKTIFIQRVQNLNNSLTGEFAKTSRECPPFCIQAINIAPDVKTFGELEVIQFIKDNENSKHGLLIDARSSSWHAKGTIPNSINIPFTTFALKQNDKQMKLVMKNLGVKPREKNTQQNWSSIKERLGISKSNPYWDYSSAKNLLVWCNGPWSDHSSQAIHTLLKLGYPAKKLHYYRAGMQGWQALGLSVFVPE